jgi:hypothetical protein
LTVRKQVPQGSNVLKFSSVAGSAPQIDSILLQQNKLCSGSATAAA